MDYSWNMIYIMIAQKVAFDFSDSNTSFRTKLYAEITEKYLSEATYNPVMVIAGLRIKIEEVIYQQLDPEDQEAYIAETSCYFW